MRTYEVITPLRNGTAKAKAPGSIVELNEETGGRLAKIGAVRLVGGTKAAAKPQGSGSSEEKSLSKMNKAELLAVAKAEDVAVADDATNKAIVAAIEAKREAAKAPAGGEGEGAGEGAGQGEGA